MPRLDYYGGFSNEDILGIMSEDEYLFFYNKDLLQKENLVLVSIKDENKMSFGENRTSGFTDVLQIKFKDRSPVSDEIGEEIREFIIKNKDKQFLIHCAAGVSRSAGVGKAVECIKHFGIEGLEEYKKTKSPIDECFRYDANVFVFDKITKGK